MTDNASDFDARLAAVESRLEEMAADIAAVQRLATVLGRSIAAIEARGDENHTAIIALGAQTAANFKRLADGLQKLTSYNHDTGNRS